MKLKEKPQLYSMQLFLMSLFPFWNNIHNTQCLVSITNWKTVYTRKTTLKLLSNAWIHCWVYHLFSLNISFSVVKRRWKQIKTIHNFPFTLYWHNDYHLSLQIKDLFPLHISSSSCKVFSLFLGFFSAKGFSFFLSCSFILCLFVHFHFPYAVGLSLPSKYYTVQFSTQFYKSKNSFI